MRHCLEGDWPYFYQHEPGIPAGVIAISCVLATLWFVMKRTGAAVELIQWHFFFLGAAFLLLEVHISSRMALLFGTTWLVNSFVISGLLLLIVASNILVKQFSSLQRKQRVNSSIRNSSFEVRTSSFAIRTSQFEIRNSSFNIPESLT